MKHDLDVNIEKNYNITGFESDVIGTRIIVTRPVDDMMYGNNDSVVDPYFIIKLGNKMYRAMDIGGSGYSSDDETYKCNFESEKLTYNDIKDADSISTMIVHYMKNYQKKQ